MTLDEAINIIKSECYVFNPLNFDKSTMVNTALDIAIQALEQEPCENEIMLTKEEYGQLLSNEFDNGYAKGYREALEQEPILDKTRDEVINRYPKNYAGEPELNGNAFEFSLNRILQIIDKYKAEMESEE